MFGKFVHQRDQELAEAAAKGGAAEPGSGAQLSYATELLAELLNRAAVLEEGAYWLALEKHMDAKAPKAERSPMAEGEYQLALENLAGAVRLFLTDCDEARVRAKRARLVNTDSQTEALVETGSVESEEDLAAIGGALVPSSWA